MLDYRQLLTSPALRPPTAGHSREYFQSCLSVGQRIRTGSSAAAGKKWDGAGLYDVGSLVPGRCDGAVAGASVVHGQGQDVDKAGRHLELDGHEFQNGISSLFQRAVAQCAFVKAFDEG